MGGGDVDQRADTVVAQSSWNTFSFFFFPTLKEDVLDGFCVVLDIRGCFRVFLARFQVPVRRRSSSLHHLTYRVVVFSSGPHTKG